MEEAAAARELFKAQLKNDVTQQKNFKNDVPLQKKFKIDYKRQPNLPPPSIMVQSLGPIQEEDVKT